MTYRLLSFGLIAAAVAGIGGGATAQSLSRRAAPPAAPVVASASWRTVAPENLLVVDTAKGRILVELEPRVAPRSVERIRTLTEAGFYDGLKFHRVIPNFMAQTGDPLGTGAGNSDLPDLAAELTFRRGQTTDWTVVPNAGTGVRGLFGAMPVQSQPDAQMYVTADMKVNAQGLFCPGVMGMARSNALDSANSQFFFMTGSNASLDGAYTTFGRVLSGLDVVKALKPGSATEDGKVTDPDVMTRVRIAASLPEAERPVVRVMPSAEAASPERVAAIRSRLGTNFTICDIDVPAEVTGG